MQITEPLAADNAAKTEIHQEVQPLTLPDQPPQSPDRARQLQASQEIYSQLERQRNAITCA